MFDFCVLIATFNRSKQFKAVVSQIQEAAARRSFAVVYCVVDDGSDQKVHPYASLIKKWQQEGYQVRFDRNCRNFGRVGFWRTWNLLMQTAKKEKWEYAVALPDDHILCDDFLFRVKRAFELLWKGKDVTAVAMNILVRSKRNWGRNRFVDGAFICRRVFFDCLKWKLFPIDPVRFGKSGAEMCISSGVGRQMTDRLAVNQKYRIARVRDVSFLKPMRVQSVMFPPDKFPQRPENWKLGNSNFIDG